MTVKKVYLGIGYYFSVSILMCIREVLLCLYC